MVPKGATGGKAIWEFINVTLDPDRPGRAAQDQRLRPEQSRRPPSFSMRNGTRSIPARPENYAKMLPGGIAWYAKNATQARQDLIDVLAG